MLPRLANLDVSSPPAATAHVRWLIMDEDAEGVAQRRLQDSILSYGAG
ncbi:hypothetical protein [Salinispora arenicola]|nr:hypothetical protein [Salinispora arenicola]